MINNECIHNRICELWYKSEGKTAINCVEDCFEADIIGDYDYERVEKLIKADKEGKCAILPCKNWLDVVFGNQEIFYAIDDEDSIIKKITVNNEERFEWYGDYTTITIIGRDEKGNYFGFSPEEIGEDVFLTFEEAKKKLNK